MNSYIKSGFLFLIFLSLAVAGYAQSGKTDTTAAQISSVSEFEVNGLKVLLKRRVSAPTVAVGLFIRGGSRNYDDKSSGIENLMLNAAIDSGKKFSRDAVRRELSRTGSGITAAAGSDYSAVSLVSTKQNFGNVWDIFADVMMNPAFIPADVDRIRQQIISGLREAEINPDSALDALQDRVIYAGHPYARDPSGTISTIGSFTVDQVRAYHQSVMQTSQLLLVVAGDLEENDLKARIAATFGKLPRGAYKGEPLAPLDFSKPTLDIAPRNLQTNYVQGVFSAPPLTSPDYYAMRVATSILGERVFEEVRKQRQLSYSPDASLNTSAANTGFIYVTAVDANQAVSVMLDIIKNLKTNPVDEDQIEGMAGQFLTNYYLKQETNAAQAGDLARYELIGGGWRNSFEFLNRMREVKPKDVQAVANKYMKNLRFVVIGNPQAINRSIFLQN